MRSDFLYTGSYQCRGGCPLTTAGGSSIFVYCYFFRQPSLIPQLQEFYEKHPIGQTLFSKFNNGGTAPSPFSIQNGVLNFKEQFFIPLETQLQEAIIREFHSSPVGGIRASRGPCHTLLPHLHSLTWLVILSWLLKNVGFAKLASTLLRSLWGC